MLDNLDAEPNEQTTENLADDSTGATDATLETDVIEGDGDTDTTEGESGDLSDEELVYELDGEEVSAADIKKWKAGHLMQSDYTKKTQALSDDRKKLDADRQTVDATMEVLSGIESELQELILGDLSGANLEELMEDDPSQYLKIQKQISDRSGKLQQLKAKFQKEQEKVAAQGFSQLQSDLGWNDQAKFNADKKTILEYAQSAGITQQEFAKVTSPGVMKALLEAAKYRELMAKKPATVKRVKAAPKTSKPAASNQSKPLSLAERMYGKKSA